MSNGECEDCGALGEVKDGYCYPCYEYHHFNGHCPECGQSCKRDNLSDNGVCIKCEGVDAFFNTFDKGER